MATQEEVAELRAEVVRLRTQVETITAAEQGARAQLDEDLKAEVRAFHAHLRAMEEILRRIKERSCFKWHN